MFVRTEFEKYQNNILGIISDINFPRNGVKDSGAGILFAKSVKEVLEDITILLQSSQKEMEKVVSKRAKEYSQALEMLEAQAKAQQAIMPHYVGQ